MRQQVEAGAAEPVYLITGTDEAQKGELAACFAEGIDPELRPFNVQRFMGGEAPLGAVLDAARTLPFAAPRRVVIVTQAEKLLEPKRESAAAMRALEAFEAYVKAPVAETVLVVVAGALDRRTRIAKLLTQRAALVECDGVETPDAARRLVRGLIGAASRTIAPDALDGLLARIGLDAPRLRADVERLLLYVGERDTIVRDDVLAVVGEAVSQDDWAVVNAIEGGRAPDALRELALSLDAGVPPLKILGQLAWFVRSRLAAHRAGAVVDAVFRTDLDMKRSAGDPRVLLERLVVELCAATARR